MFRNFKVVSHVVFGRSCFSQLDDILVPHRQETGSFMVFLVDDVFTERSLRDRLPVKDQDLLLWVNVDDEPKTVYVDELTAHGFEISRFGDFEGNSYNHESPYLVLAATRKGALL